MRKTADGRGFARVSATSVAVINGEDDLSTWDDEELERGMRRGKDGRFRKPPVLVAKAVHDELVKRRMSRAYDLLRESTYDAVVVLRSVALDEDADAKVRVEAASTILDRVLGKAPQHVSLDIEAPWMKIMAEAIVSRDDADVPKRIDVPALEPSAAAAREPEAPEPGPTPRVPIRKKTINIADRSPGENVQPIAPARRRKALKTKAQRASE
jgi:hypothetical protein